MDYNIYIEQLSPRTVSAGSRVIQALIIVAAIITCSIVVLIPQILPVALALSAAIIVGAVILIRRQNVEFEYIQNGFDLEVDKIYAKSSRKGICEIDLKSVEEFYVETRTRRELKRSFSEVYDCAGDGEVYALVYPGEEGREMLLFTPEDKLLEAMRRVISPRIWKK